MTLPGSVVGVGRLAGPRIGCLQGLPLVLRVPYHGTERIHADDVAERLDRVVQENLTYRSLDRPSQAGVAG
ncbi:hypothetical protein D3C80_2042130 [compost metagenome]